MLYWRESQYHHGTYLSDHQKSLKQPYAWIFWVKDKITGPMLAKISARTSSHIPPYARPLGTYAVCCMHKCLIKMARCQAPSKLTTCNTKYIQIWCAHLLGQSINWKPSSSGTWQTRLHSLTPHYWNSSLCVPAYVPHWAWGVFLPQTNESNQRTLDRRGENVTQAKMKSK